MMLLGVWCLNETTIEVVLPPWGFVFEKTNEGIRLKSEIIIDWTEKPPEVKKAPQEKRELAFRIASIMFKEFFSSQKEEKKETENPLFLL